MIDKLLRAQTIVSHVFELDPVFGYNMHPRIPGVTTPSREIGSDPRWRCSLGRGGRIFLGWVTPDVIGERVEREADCTIVEITVRGKRCFAANVRGAEIELFLFEPGIWETWFGADPGSDTVSYSTMILPDERDPNWCALRETADFKIAPLRDGTPIDPQGGRKRTKRPKRLNGSAHI